MADYDLLSGLAKDASLQSLLTAIGAITADPTANTVQARLKAVLTAIETLTTTAATVGTAGTTNASANKDALVANASANKDALVANASANKDALVTALESLRDALKGASNKDFTTVQVALDALKTRADLLASEATLLAFKVEAKSESDETQQKLDTLNAKDFATQATLALLQSRAALLATEARQSPLDRYKIADDSGTGSVRYYGFLAVSGDWVVLKENKSAAPYTYRYANGSNNAGAAYAAAWADRATLAYAYLDTLTGV